MVEVEQATIFLDKFLKEGTEEDALDQKVGKKNNISCVIEETNNSYLFSSKQQTRTKCS